MATFRKGQKVFHKTLGLVRITHSVRKDYWSDNEDTTRVTILDDSKRQTNWLSDFGRVYNTLVPTEATPADFPWKVKAINLTPYRETLKKQKLGPVQWKIRKLWNESNWVKLHPEQAIK